MKNFFYGVFAVITMVFMTACDSGTSTSVEPTSDSPEALVSNNFEWIVEYSGKTNNAIDAITARGGVVLNQLDEVNMILAGGIGNDDARELEALDFIKLVVANETVQFAPDLDGPFGAGLYQGPTAGVQNINPADALAFAVQWNMQEINMVDAWTVATGNGIRVGILDTGGSPTHQDLVGKYDLAASKNFTSPDPSDWEDRYGHGTHVSGTVSTNNIVVAGVAPDVTLVAVKVLGDQGFGSFFWIIEGILYASDPEGGNCDIINMSLGGSGSKQASGKFLSLVYRATQRANQRGCLVVVSAGNDARDMDHSGNFVTIPAQSGNSMAISSTGPLNQADFTQLSWFSNYGTSAISVAAPGGNFIAGVGYAHPLDGVLSCRAPAISGGATDAYFHASGTSMAAPHVAGVAALVAEARGGKPGSIRSRIERNAMDLGKSGADPQYGKGFLDAAAAVK